MSDDRFNVDQGASAHGSEPENIVNDTSVQQLARSHDGFTIKIHVT